MRWRCPGRSRGASRSFESPTWGRPEVRPTKDSDWIIAPDDMDPLRGLFIRLEGQSAPWRVSYRDIFGAPLDAEFTARGWTSHLFVTEPNGTENKVDSFCPPRGTRTSIRPAT